MECLKKIKKTLDKYINTYYILIINLFKLNMKEKINKQQISFKIDPNIVHGLDKIVLDLRCKTGKKILRCNVMAEALKSYVHEYYTENEGRSM